MFISETNSFTQETYMCVFPSLTSFNTKPSGRGTAFNHTIRQVYYTLRSIGISVSTIDFVIRPVLSMVDIDIFTQETYMCVFPSLTSFTPNVNGLSYFFYLCRVKVMDLFGGSITKHSLVCYAINLCSNYEL
jgi:hypothetical protein